MNKFTAVAIFEAIATNPNGDPGNLNMPRMLGEQGWFTGVSSKRHWRDMIHGEHPVVLEVLSEMNLDANQYRIATTKLTTKVTDIAKELSNAKANNQMPFVDVRLFGAMVAAEDKDDSENSESEEKSKKKSKKDKKSVRFIETGAVVVDPALSVHPVDVSAPTITRIYGTDDDKERAMGVLPMVHYGIYAQLIHLNNTAEILRASMTRPEDIEFLKRTYPYVTDTRSATRSLNLLNFYWYDHSRASGDIADFRLFDMLKPKPLVERPTKRSEFEFANVAELSKQLKGKLQDHAL